MLWNIGHGPAVIENIKVTASTKPRRPDDESRRDQVFVDRLPSFATLGAGGFADVEIPSPAWPDVARAVTLRVLYRHVNGTRFETVSEATIDGNFLDCVTYERVRIREPRRWRGAMDGRGRS